MDRILFAILLIISTNYALAAEGNGTAQPEDDVEICKMCHCNDKGRYVNCANKNLFHMFTNNSWKSVTNRDNLITIEFDNNGLEVLPQFPDMPTRELSFKNNKIRKIEQAAFRNLTMLEKLDLSFNRLTFAELKKESFEGKFAVDKWEPLKNLRWLSLSNNDFHSLDPDLFSHLPNLEVLILSYNPFKKIDANTAIAVSNIGRLTTLDLSNMELKELPDHIFHAPSKTLKNLNLTGNLFNSIPEAIGDAVNLVQLNMNDNIIERIGGNNSKFPHLPKLESLSISDMISLKEIGEGAFSGLDALKHFSCQDNIHLDTIHKDAFGRPGVDKKEHESYPPIRSLILYNNNLSKLDHNLIARWDEVEEIDIRHNPWKCDCDTQWMLDPLMPLIKDKSKANPSMYEDVKCASPTEMARQSLSELATRNYHMRCEDYYGRRPERDAPILIGIFIGLIIGIPVAMGIILAYKRGCFGIFGYRPRANDYTRAFYKRAPGLSEDMQHI